MSWQPAAHRFIWTTGGVVAVMVASGLRLVTNPASGEVGQAIKLVIGGPANLTAHLTTCHNPGSPSVE